MKRDTYFDFLRGFAILLVVAIHTYNGGDFNSFEGFVQICTREFCNVSVPFFIVISGYFIGKKDLTCKSDYILFLKKQLLRVYIPCIIWSLPIFLKWQYAGNNMYESILCVLSCSALVPYYYIALIIQFYILTPVFKRYIESRKAWGGNCG